MDDRVVCEWAIAKSGQNKRVWFQVPKSKDVY